MVHLPYTPAFFLSTILHVNNANEKTMKIRLSIAIALLLVIYTVSAQTLGDFKPGKGGPSSLDKRKFKNKDVYIADFAVHYQVYAQESTTNKGNQGLVSGVMGKAKASLSVGLDIPTATLERITNQAYVNFIGDLQAQGFNVLNGDAAKETDYFKNYKYGTNLSIVPSRTAEGSVTVHPQNVGFFYKEKGPYAAHTKLSSELNDAAVIRVEMFIDFVEMGDFNKGFGASVNAKTNLILSDKNTILHLIVGKNKIGGSPLGEYQGILKKSLEINGVIKEEKISSYAKSDYDNAGVATAFGKIYSAKNNSTSKIALVSSDADKYEKGVTLAIDTFLKYHTNEFTNKFFKK